MALTASSSRHTVTPRGLQTRPSRPVVSSDVVANEIVASASASERRQPIICRPLPQSRRVWNQSSRLTKSSPWTDKIRTQVLHYKATSLKSRSRTDGFQSPTVRLFPLPLPALLICASSRSHLHVDGLLQRASLDAYRLSTRASLRRITEV